MPLLAPRLRIHLVGSDEKAKRGLAVLIRKEANKNFGRMNFIIVENLSNEIAERFPDENIAYFMALESAYHKFESEGATKTKHLIFIDSVIDRFLRVKKLGVDLNFYFEPRLRDFREDQAHFLLYGPDYDKERSSILMKLHLPAQTWTHSEQKKRADIMEALSLRAQRHGR